MRFERDLALVGAEAVGWMREHGWRVIGSGDRFRLTADTARSPEFNLNRLWHSAAVTSIELPEDCADFKFVTFLLEGTITLVTDGGACRMSAPSHFFVDETVSVQMASTEPSSRLIIGLPKTLYHWMPEELTIPARPYRAEALYRESLMSSATASLRGRVRRSDESFRYWTAGMESLALAAVFSATINDRDGGDTVPTPEEAETQREVLADALLFIEIHGHDPQLSVGRLAERLGVSRAKLYRAFQPTGLSPGAHLRRAITKHRSDAGLRDPALSSVAVEPKPASSPMPRKIFV
ncbi:helix-turn-helix transcriptional regulator [Pseudoclavibacter sp. VKM Ac-2867]|uniref:helix-turn-helix transcriptional regulator n=1 Tax=Pseudoclavibacter sp. VKM Ac-2867 TaxID=2783829 RepID=UPI00188D78D9|nr:helix-turn-helix transcriptional regulator [Pseudoclavibacter sp. VKM Ac-2867]MBF4459514.1 helix-turn-helix transcriptional regulator [Pseudoclavibacter sp. VKM Ac-2867]